MVVRILRNTVVPDVMFVIMDEMVAERMLAGIIVRTKFRRTVGSLSRRSSCSNYAFSYFLRALYLLD